MPFRRCARVISAEVRSSNAFGGDTLNHQNGINAATAVCGQLLPRLEEVAADHRAACFNPAEPGAWQALRAAAL